MSPRGATSGLRPGPWVSWDLLVLTQAEGCQGGHHGAQAARDGPPGVLDEEAEDDEDATEGVVHKHHLGYAPEDPAEELEHWGFVCNGTSQGSGVTALGEAPEGEGVREAGHPRWVQLPAVTCHRGG